MNFWTLRHELPRREIELLAQHPAEVQNGGVVGDQMHADFSARLSQAMDKRGLRQADLVRMAANEGVKLGKSQLSQYLSGKTEPRKATLSFLASALGVSAEWLLGAADAPTPQEMRQRDCPLVSSTKEKETTMPRRQFKKSSKLDNVLYDIRGPVLDEAYRMEDQGIHVLKLNIGNPAPFGFRTPDEVVKDMQDQLTECEGYSNSRGLFSARKAIMQYDQLKGIPKVDVEDIYTGNGASELIQLAMNAFMNEGDEILVPSPDYPLWTACATLAGGTAVHYICDEKANWYPDIDDIRSKVTPRTKGIVVINPNNPTGALYPREVLQQIVDVARENQLVIFADEIYDRLVMDGKQHVSIASLAPDLFCITFNGLSKSHMVAGYRIGWMSLSGNKRIAKDLIEGINMLSNMRLCSNVPAQSIVQTLADYAGVPVWNGLTTEFHPTQMLADVLTMREEFGNDLSGRKLTFMGDAGNNVGNSLMVVCAKLGIDFCACGPEKQMPAPELVEQCRAIAAENGSTITLTEDVDEGARNASVIYTDIWVSMGEPDSLWAERIKLLKPYQVTADVMAKAAPDAIFMHCLPSFHDRHTTIGEDIYEKFGLAEMEVTNEVFEGPRSRVFDEAENRMHTIKAVMYATLK